MLILTHKINLRGFGFIRPEGRTNGQEVFVHYKDLMLNRKQLNLGEEVKFTLVLHCTGGERAVEVIGNGKGN